MYAKCAALKVGDQIENETRCNANLNDQTEWYEPMWICFSWRVEIDAASKQEWF